MATVFNPWSIVEGFEYGNDQNQQDKKFALDMEQAQAREMRAQQQEARAAEQAIFNNQIARNKLELSQLSTEEFRNDAPNRAAQSRLAMEKNASGLASFDVSKNLGELASQDVPVEEQFVRLFELAKTPQEKNVIRLEKDKYHLGQANTLANAGLITQAVLEFDKTGRSNPFFIVEDTNKNPLVISKQTQLPVSQYDVSYFFKAGGSPALKEQNSLIERTLKNNFNANASGLALPSSTREVTPQAASNAFNASQVALQRNNVLSLKKEKDKLEADILKFRESDDPDEKAINVDRKTRLASVNQALQNSISQYRLYGSNPYFSSPIGVEGRIR